LSAALFFSLAFRLVSDVLAGFLGSHRYPIAELGSPL
jgi:hypothetical protein